MTEPAKTQTRRSPLWMRLLLGVSLAANLAVIGLGVGLVLRGPDGRAGAHPPRTGGAMIRALPHKDRRAIFKQARDAAQDVGKPAPGELSAVLRAAPYDHAALQDYIARQHAQREQWITTVQAAWLAHVSQMSDAERLDYADAIEAVEQRRRDKRRKPPKPDQRD